MLHLSLSECVHMESGFPGWKKGHMHRTFEIIAYEILK